MLSNVAEFCMHLIVFHGKNDIEKSEKSTKKRDSRREKRHLDFSLSLTLVLTAEFGTKIKFDLSTFIQKLLFFIKNYSTIHRSDKMKAIFHTSKFRNRENLTKARQNHKILKILIFQ